MILRDPQDVCNFFGCFMTRPEEDCCNLYAVRPELHATGFGDGHDVIGWFRSDAIGFSPGEYDWQRIWEPHVLFDHSVDIYFRPEYRLVRGSFKTISAEMTKLSKQGWYPSGQMFVQGDTFFQVMALRIRRIE